jgi:hypothetical protein
MDKFLDLNRDIKDVDISKQHRAVIDIRIIVCIKDNPPIEAVIETGLIPNIIEFIKQQEYPQLQLYAVRVLVRVSCGTREQCMSIVDNGGIPFIVNLLISNNMYIIKEAIKLIGNIAKNCSSSCINIVQAGGL